jgi:DNA-binding Xre family transcriptional regulator
MELNKVPTDRIDFPTLDKLCRYFLYEVGDVLTYEADSKELT